VLCAEGSIAFVGADQPPSDRVARS